MIPYGRQNISDEDIDSVIEVLKSDFLTQGPKVPEFENAIAKYTGSKGAVAVNSATSALHIACLALGLGKGDILWTTPITFVASANCALYCGAEVNFIDIDPLTYNLSVSALEEKLIESEKMGRLPKVVVPVHLCGQSCDMESIYELSKKYNFKIIEDASHAIGGKYKGDIIGSCKFSDITVFSFHPVKIITSAEGGVAVTNNAELKESMELLRSHGVSRNPELLVGESDGDWYYQQLTLGFNYRMTELQAALGLSQMKRLDVFVEKRHKIANRYLSELQNLDIVLPHQNDDCYSSFHLFPIRVKAEKRKYIFDELRKNEIGVNVHYIPVHTQPFYRDMACDYGCLEEAEKYYSECISLPLYPDLTAEDQDYIISTLKKLL